MRMFLLKWNKNSFSKTVYALKIIFHKQRKKTSKTSVPGNCWLKDFFSKCEIIAVILWIRSHLLKKSLMEIFIFYAV